MKKRIMTLAIAGVLSMGILAGCGNEAPAETVVEEPATEAEEETEEVEEVEETEEAEETEETDADASEAEFTYDTGFYVTDGSSDAVICFFVGSDGTQVAYVNDGENEAFAEYDAVEAELEDGTPYVLVTVGDEVLGYVTDGEDEYIVDSEGNLLAAAELSEAEADAILEAVAAAE